jgi:catabolite regulation protein CreA
VQYKAKSEVIAFASASLFFTTFKIHRAVDAEKNVLVYTVVSTMLISGSPFNSISVVPGGCGSCVFGRRITDGETLERMRGLMTRAY